MPIEYLVGDKKYLLSYVELRQKYIEFCDMTDMQFLKNISSALHLACVICWLTERPGYVVLADDGIIHELCHLIDIPDGCDLTAVRKLFKEQLILS